jgi:hypothetical protein
VDGDRVGHGGDGLATLTRRRRRPPGLRLVRGIDRRIDTDGPALHRLVHNRPGRGIVNRDPVADDLETSTSDE